MSNTLNNPEESLGRLKHTTKETCEDCLKSKLQLRARNSEGKEVEYLYCPRCGFEKRPRKSKADGIWKKKVSKKDEVIVEDVKSNSQSRGNPKRDGTDSRTGYRPRK